MSSALMAIRFPDGTVKFGCYNGTSDIAKPMLIDDWGDWFSLKYQPWPAEYEALRDGPCEPVDVWTSYGDGFYWKGGVAGGLLVQGNAPFDEDEEEVDGTPDWVPVHLWESVA